MFRSCILKVTAICNLNCSYCYMFNLSDQTYKRVPPHMHPATARWTLQRIAEHLDGGRVADFHITMHGGEPSLWPVDHFEAFFRDLEELRNRGLRIGISLQTNGYRPVSPHLLDLLAENEVRIGVSLDGPQRFNDRARVSHGGRGTYEPVLDTVRDLLGSGHEDLFAGFLAVANPDIPVDVFLDWVEQLPGRRIDVLWPMQFNHDRPPWTAGGQHDYRRAPRFGTWFSDLFSAWWQRDDPSLEIRCFFDAIGFHLGAGKHFDDIVNDRLDMFVVNTDGGIEYPDYLRDAADGATRTRFTVRDHSLSQLASDTMFRSLLNLRAHRPEACAGCRHVGICGGGFLPGRAGDHRFDPSRRSVLCFDQYHFFSTVEACVSGNNRAHVVSPPPLVT